jgi:hypothetical protein
MFRTRAALERAVTGRADEIRFELDRGEAGSIVGQVRYAAVAGGGVRRVTTVPACR